MESASLELAEKPVFVAEESGRARVVRLVGRSATFLAVAWLVALLVAALGLGRLPAVPFRQLGSIAQKPADAAGARSSASRAAAPRQVAESARPRPGMGARERSLSRPESSKPFEGQGSSPSRRDPSTSSGAQLSQQPSGPPRSDPTLATPRAPSFTPSGHPVPARGPQAGATRPPDAVGPTGTAHGGGGQTTY
jgi:hypothetical protein